MGKEGMQGEERYLTECVSGTAPGMILLKATICLLPPPWHKQSRQENQIIWQSLRQFSACEKCHCLASGLGMTRELINVKLHFFGVPSQIQAQHKAEESNAIALKMENHQAGRATDTLLSAEHIPSSGSKAKCWKKPLG